MGVIRHTYRNESGLRPCLFCGCGEIELVETEGDDFVLRCASCHASAWQARMGCAEAIDDWNAGDVVNDRYSIAMDVSIDDYLHEGVQELLFGEYTPWDSYPETGGGFQFSEAVIVTRDSMVLIQPDRLDHEKLVYEELSWLDREAYQNPMLPDGAAIRFVRSVRRGGDLLSLEFECAGKTIRIASDTEDDCMAVFDLKRQ